MIQFRFVSFILIIACSVNATSQSKFVIRESLSEFALHYIPESKLELNVVNFNDIKFNRFSKQYFIAEIQVAEQNEICLFDAKPTSTVSNEYLKTLNNQFRGLEIPKACLIVYDRCKQNKLQPLVTAILT